MSFEYIIIVITTTTTIRSYSKKGTFLQRSGAGGEPFTRVVVVDHGSEMRCWRRRERVPASPTTITLLCP